VKKVSLFKKNILYYIDMGEDQNKSEEDRFEENLRQILDSAPSKGRVAIGEPLRPGRARPNAEPPKPARDLEAETEPKALFWFKIMRLLAMLALVACLAVFVRRITTGQ